MTVDELEEWLQTEDSQSTGWPKDDGSGESVGHESYADSIHASALSCRSTDTPRSNPRGRKIVKILKKNPKKDPEAYDEEDIAHMRKVTSYCARHLKQEESAKMNPKSKSCRSLKNWGHNPLKT
jgi:hypothetical protein